MQGTHLEDVRQIIESERQEKATLMRVLLTMANNQGPKYDLRGTKFGGGFATESGIAHGGVFCDFSFDQDVSDVALQIQELLKQLQIQGATEEAAQQQVAWDLAKRAEEDPAMLGKLVKWGQAVNNVVTKTSITEAVKSVIKLALKLMNIPL